jgi:hypothetical protein
VGTRDVSPLTGNRHVECPHSTKGRCMRMRMQMPLCHLACEASVSFCLTDYIPHIITTLSKHELDRQ